MANRIVGNVLIVDSAMGNLFVLDQNPNLSVNAIALTQVGGAGSMVLCSGSTANSVVIVDSNNLLIHFATPQRFEDLKVPVLTAGTGYIYLA